MRLQRIKHRPATTTAVTVAAVAAALLLSGCGAGAQQPQAASEPASPAVTTSSGPNASGAAGAPEAEPSSAPPSQPSTESGTALCKTAGLTATTDSTGGGAAGSVYMQLILTNAGTEPCLLKGFAGVSLTAEANGEPIGEPAARGESTPVTDVLLAPGQAGTATLRYSQPGNYTDCSRTQAAGLRVYPPEDTASLFLAQPREACSNSGINLLTISAFRAQ